jgi:quinolinate synthase
MADIKEKIRRLCREKNAVILSHTYESAEIQDLADYVGDSYGLSRKAAEMDADMIVFCGVRFMAETAAVLNPGCPVLMPDPSAGCPMADMISAPQLRELKALHPGAPVVCYVNSTAEVKAESTICCTSSNAVEVVQSLGEVPEIIFVPDQNLGQFVEKQLGRKMVLWDGCCPVHAAVRRETVEQAKAQFPQAKVMVHPECTPEVQAVADYVISTGQMVDLVKETSETEFIVGTEGGIIHTLELAAPHIRFHHLTSALHCRDMKKVTLEKVLAALENEGPAVILSDEVARGSRRAIEAMLKATRH